MTRLDAARRFQEAIGLAQAAKTHWIGKGYKMCLLPIEKKILRDAEERYVRRVKELADRKGVPV